MTFEFPTQSGHLGQPAVWVPVSLTPEELSDQSAGYWGYHMVARLRNGIQGSEPTMSSSAITGAHRQMLPPKFSTARWSTAFPANVGSSLPGSPTTLPAAGSVPLSAYTIEGASAERWKLKFAAFDIIYGDYFRALDIPLLEGRTFTTNDRPNTPLVVIVNQSMARHCWPGQRAIGRRMHTGNPQKGPPWATVVGVVSDTKVGSRDEPSIDQWYCSALQPAILGVRQDSTGLPSG